MNQRNLFRNAAWLAALAILVVVIGCSDDPVPTAPEEEPDPPRETETFTGMFGMDETSEHNFTVSARGNVEMKITSLEPLDSLTVGLGIGNWDDTLESPCTVFASDNRVVVNSVLLSAGVDPGEYCVRIGDVGNVFPDAIVTYEVEVLHP